MDSQYLPHSRGSRTTAYYQTDINALVSSILKRSQDLSVKLVSETTIGAAITNALIKNTIGPGLEPKASPEMAALDWTDEQRGRFVSQAESFFRRCAGRRSFDYYGRNGFDSLQQIGFRMMLDSGDVLVHRVYGTEREGFRPKLQILSGRWVSNPMMTDTKRSVGGVLFDEEGRESGYLILQTDESNRDTFTAKEVRKYNESGFEEFLLVGIQMHEANQVRGIPWLTTVAQDIIDLENFKIAHRTKAATQALLTAAIVSDAEAPVQQVSSIDRIRNLEGGDRHVGPVPGEDSQSNLELGAGNVISLNPGERMDMLESKSPMSSYKEYVMLELSQIGGATLVPYEMMTQTFNSNYSSSRATIMGAAEAYRALKEEFATKFCDPVWDFVIDWGIRTGQIEAPGYIEGSDMYRDAILACTWIGPSAVILDPTREMGAHILAIQNNLEPMAIPMRELFGIDFDEAVESIAKEKAALREKGLQTQAYNSFKEKAPLDDGRDGEDGKEDSTDGE